MISLLLAATLTLPPDAVVVRVAEDGWPERVAAAKAEVPEGEQRVWWWSDRCAVQKVTSEVAVTCGLAEQRRVDVVDRASKKPIRGARVIWATDAMRADIPEAMLPFVLTGDDGSGVLSVPTGVMFHVRVAGPRFATWWTSSSRLFADEASDTVVHLLTADRAPATRAIIDLQLPVLAQSASALRSRAVGADGKITLYAVPPIPFVVVAWSEASAPLVTTIAPSQLSPRIELPRGISVAGRIVDAKRKPLPSAAVETVFNVEGMPRGLRRRLRSASNGRFVANGLPPGAIQLMVKHTGRATVLRRVEPDADLDVGDITLNASRALNVRVVDIAGEPISGATVRTGEGVYATSGRDGVGRLTNVPADDDIVINATARGFRAKQVHIAADSEWPGVITLSRGVRIKASVLDDETGERASAGDVLIVNNGARRAVPFEDGTIDVAGLDRGTLELEVRARGLAPKAFAEHDVEEDDVWDLGTLRLTTGSAIKGRVVVRDDGAPLAAATVRALRRHELAPSIAFVMGDWVEAVTDDEGSFSIDGLSAEPHVLLIDAAGFAPRVMRAAISTDDGVTIELDRARTLVIDCAPVHRCGDEARLLYGGAAYPWAASTVRLRGGRAHVGIAAPGTALLRLVRNGQVTHERSVQVSADAETGVSIRLGRTRVRGTVVSGGRPQRGGIVELSRDLRDPGGLPVYLESRTAEGQVTAARWLTSPPHIESTSVDDSGTFAFDEIDAGEFLATYRGESGRSKPMRILIPDAPEFRLTFDVPPGALQGRVMFDDGTPASLATVRIVDAQQSESIADADRHGWFDIAGLAPGRATVTAISGQWRASQAVDVDGRAPSTVDFILTKRN